MTITFNPQKVMSPYLVLHGEILQPPAAVVAVRGQPLKEVIEPDQTILDDVGVRRLREGLIELPR